MPVRSPTPQETGGSFVWRCNAVVIVVGGSVGNDGGVGNGNCDAVIDEVIGGDGGNSGNSKCCSCPNPCPNPPPCSDP